MFVGRANAIRETRDLWVDGRMYRCLFTYTFIWENLNQDRARFSTCHNDKIV